jgi:hypothetical protein
MTQTQTQTRAERDLVGRDLAEQQPEPEPEPEPEREREPEINREIIPNARDISVKKIEPKRVTILVQEKVG